MESPGQQGLVRNTDANSLALAQAYFIRNAGSGVQQAVFSQAPQMLLKLAEVWKLLLYRTKSKLLSTASKALPVLVPAYFSSLFSQHSWKHLMLKHH